MKAIALLFIFSSVAFAGQTTERKIFNLEKSLNSENILTIITHTDEFCKFVANNNEYIDFYWLMDGSSKKDVHPMIRSKVHERVKFVGINSTRDTFSVRLNDLSEIKHDLESNIIEVKSEFNNGVCQVKPIIKLGASAKYRTLSLKRTYCDVETNMIGVPKGCRFLELQGTDYSTNEQLKIRFKGK